MWQKSSPDNSQRCYTRALRGIYYNDSMYHVNKQALKNTFQQTPQKFKYILFCEKM